MFAFLCRVLVAQEIIKAEAIRVQYAVNDSLASPGSREAHRVLTFRDPQQVHQRWFGLVSSRTRAK